MNSGEKRKLIGKVYNSLIEAQREEYSLQKIYEGWNKDLNITDTNIIWKESLNLTNNITTNENLHIQYKLMTTIYYTKSKIHKFDSSSSALCVKCCTQEDTIIHAFWECDKVKRIWMEIQNWMANTCGTDFKLALQCIFQKIDHLKCPIG